MAKKTSAPQEPEETILVSAAKVLGSAAGKIASLVGATTEAQPAAKSKKIPKLMKKERTRLPRKQKKAQQKKRAAIKS